MTLPSSISVGTWNVRYDNPTDGEHRWEMRRERLVALLRSWMPDVVGLQEPYRHQLDYLRQALPEREAVGVGRDDGAAAGEHCAIFYRRDRFRATDSGTFWLSEEPDTPGSKGWDARHARICTWVDLVEQSRAASFTVYNLHLDHESQAARENGVGLLLERIRQHPAPGPVIVLGDFNATPDNPAIVRMGGAVPPLRSALSPPEGTFHGFRGRDVIWTD